MESHVTHKRNADDGALSPSKWKKVGSVTAVKPIPPHLFGRKTLAPVILIGLEHNKDSDIFIPYLNNSIKNEAPWAIRMGLVMTCSQIVSNEFNNTYINSLDKGIVRRLFVCYTDEDTTNMRTLISKLTAVHVV
jgi:hypothetical protein